MLGIDWKNGQAGGTPLSAENLKLMQTDIENAINEVQTNVDNIIESSSNYTKFVDGTLICFGRITGTSNLYDFWGQLKRSEADITFDFPIEFIAPPKITMTAIENAIVSIVGGQHTTTQGKFTILKPNANVSNQYEFDYIAIGRWK